MTQVIRIAPKNALGYYYRGVAYNELKQYKKAAADIRKYVEVDGISEQMRDWIKAWEEGRPLPRG